MIGRKGLATLFASAALYVMGCEKPSSLQPCSYDVQCPPPGVCIDSLCVSPCAKDTDCPEPLVCDQGQCASSSGNSSYSSKVSPKTPVETWDEFTKVLQDNDLEGAVSLFSDHVQEKYRTILGQKQLPDLARALKDARQSSLPTYRGGGTSHSFLEGDITIGGEVYPITFYCHDDACRINSF